MKIKTSDATPLQVDWLVAKCEGYTPFSDGISWVIDDRGTYKQLPKYASDWSQGGPIIEREKISVWFVEEYADEVGKVMCKAEWYAEYREGRPYHSATGPTPLVAAMRYYVASKLGEYVDVPEELV